MPSSCCVIGCKSRGTAQPGVLFFQLPLNKPSVLTQWLIVLDRRDWIPKPSSRICSLHFTPDDYITRPNQTAPRLKPDAIPSVFPDLGDDEEEKDSSSSSPQKENDVPSGKSLDVTNEPLVKLPSSKSKLPSIVSTPVNMSPSQRPRRVSKVSSKMKDYILLDDIKKNRQTFSPASKVIKTDPAAQELLSILEDSNSLSGDESKFSSPKARQPTIVANSEIKTPLSEKKGILITSSELKKPSLSEKKGISIQEPLATKINTVEKVKQKPAPASVKRAKELAALKESVAKKLTEEIKLPLRKQNPFRSKAKTVPEAFRKTYFQVKDGDKVIYLSYADLNPVADMTKDNVLYKTGSFSTSQTNLLSLLDKEIKEERMDSESDSACESALQEIENGESSTLFEASELINEIAKNLQNGTKKKQNKRTSKKAQQDLSNLLDLTENCVATISDDAEVVDSDSSLKLLSEKNIGSSAIKKFSKNFKVASPVKRKKRFKTVAEIVVRTDHSGQVPSVSIEKMTNLETNETPRKRAKVVNKPSTPPIQNNFVTPSTEEDDLSTLSERITETIKKMKLLEKVKGNAAKLTVLITTLPPVQENELLIIKKKNTETNAEQSRELRVAISSYKASSDANLSGEISNNQQSNGDPVFGVPILGACESGELPGNETVELTLNQESKIISGNQENLASSGNMEISSGENTELIINSEMSENSNPVIVRNDAVVTPPSVKEGGSDGTGVSTSAPLQHDHTYISPSLKVTTEPEVIGDDHVKELFSKLKLTEEEISYRSKVHKKLRFLKETVKRKTETINKLKQKVIFLEKSLREERKTKKKLNVVSKRKPGFESNNFYEGMMEGSKSASFQGNANADFEENLEESDEDGRGSNSPITYICEPAIDVCEKAEPEE